MSCVAGERVPRRAEVEPVVSARCPFAPHIDGSCGELGHSEASSMPGWPAFDAGFVADERLELVIQVNGKHTQGCACRARHRPGRGRCRRTR